jgi:hypothetical protein
MAVARKRSSKRAPARLAVQSGAAKGLVGASAPLLPHERDESPAAPPSAPRRIMIQAHVDTTSGLVDTDRRQDAPRVFAAAARRRRTTGRK